MNERDLSRGLSTHIVDALKAHGHILVVRGGATALARELGELMTPAAALLSSRQLPSHRAGEALVDDAVDRIVDELVIQISRALMTSDHVEDVFAEDAVIRRDVLRAVREGLRSPPTASERRAEITVSLDTLGYVAATVSKRSDLPTLQRALDRAAASAHAHLVSYDPGPREAVFRVDDGGADERLELEEAVADELADLAEQGVTPLPTIEKRVDVGRHISPGDQRSLSPRIEAAAEKTLFRSGCAAEWAFSDERTIRVVFTPLSEQDARGVELPVAAFARELSVLLGPAEPRPTVKAAELPSPEPSTGAGVRDAASRELAAAPPAASASPPSAPSPRGKKIRPVAVEETAERPPATRKRAPDAGSPPRREKPPASTPAKPPSAPKRARAPRTSSKKA